MSFTDLHIRDFRNIESAEIQPIQGVNFFVGANGSGKTSVLEALYFLGRGRSFRSSQLTQLVREQTDSFIVRASVVGREGNTHQIGVAKQRGVQGVRLRMDGVDLASREPIGDLVPLVLINSDSYRLVEGGPKYRRQFVDWGMFHVEHSGREAWRQYRRVLKQRNAALRGSPSQLSLWSDQLAEHAVVLDDERRRFIQRIAPRVADYAELLLGRPAELGYRVPWDGLDTLRRLMEESVEADRRAGFSKVGSHRANVVALVDGKNSRERLSRGQEKLMVYALMLALVGVLREEKGVGSSLLVDDMAAELDVENQEKVLGTLAEFGTQLFVTGTQLAEGVKQLSEEPKVFHVKHGTVSDA